MRTYRADTTATQARQGGATFADVVTATAIASACLVIVSLGVAMLIWRAPWWELSLALGLAPFALLGLGMLLYLKRNLLWTLEDLTGWDLNGDGTAGEPERVRLVPVRGRTLINECDAEDLAFFTRAAMGSQDWTQKTWRGRRMPSGKNCDGEYHARLVACLTKAGIIADYGRGTAGHLTVHDTDEALELLGLQPD